MRERGILTGILTVKVDNTVILTFVTAIQREIPGKGSGNHQIL
jgi:hypothetical protein